MINKVDKAIISILLKVAQILTNYSTKIGSYEIYAIGKMIEEINEEVNVNGD